MRLTRLIYASKHDDTDAETLDRILQTSRANNVRDGITGALVINQHNFLQLLEGDRGAIGQCFMRIMQDDRHHDIQVIATGEAAHRLFVEWSMHRIETSRIKTEILSHYLVEGVFDPSRMSQRAIEDLCRTLSGGGWEALAA
jgi:hypothetical protein